ncbi:MAG: DNA mismatch repair endonuclease MutL [Lachnospiraceae bacterium]|jgi:DNA mismatch repair protein MutL|nr:DNA mismatch repair endonuclease MutL [Lachnospiraceae bacterium]MCI9602133.1 DNA mismatch repair endonuclease MutL [Lachnospiraceae bacterium]
MGRIAVLDQQTIDRIAAGEVVERPASVVKELVENAVDAGASQVTVEIREGGIGYIRITDNGSGIEKEDIPLAFLRHSTSKIRSAEDLTGVTSLGFRGEALSSISAVSMVELITKTRTELLGSRCCLEGGIKKSLEETGAPDGTTFIIRNLFYNTPARKKFLKTEMSEAAAVHELMTRLALSHPEISFKVFIHNQMKLQTAGNGSLKDVIYHIYGRDIAMRLLPVDRKEGPLHLTGFIGKPEISRGNRNYENYFVNGRYVKSRIIARGIEDGYKTFMMQHRYPFVCLNFHMDGTMLDVNVHPAKMELRFSRQNLVYDMVQRTVKEALSGKELIPEVTIGKETKEPASIQDRKAAVSLQAAVQEPVSLMEEPDQKPVLPVRKPDQNPVSPVQEPNRKPLSPVREPEQELPEPVKEPDAPADQDLAYFMAEMKKRVEERHRREQQMLKEDNGYQAEPETARTETAAEAVPEQLSLFDGKLLSKEAVIRHEIIGQLFGTYWLVQYGDRLYIIDQHAAHEKVLYERLMKDLRERTFQSQLLSPPIVLNLSMQEEQLFIKYRQNFADMGFEIEEFGDRAYAVRAVPSNLPGIARHEILLDLLDSLSEISPNISSDTLLDKMASMSCRAAVKGNRQMTAMEAKALIDELLTLENPYNCPHGRPTIISMTKHELEKKFKRIV